MRRNGQPRTRTRLELYVEKVALLLAMIGAALAAWILRGVLLIFVWCPCPRHWHERDCKTLANKFRIGYAAGLSIVVLIGLILIGAIGWFLGAAIGDQLDELARKIPTGVQWLNDQIETRPYARDLLAKLQTADLSGPTGWIAGALATTVRLAVAAAGSLVAMAIIAIYLAAQPQRYRDAHSSSAAHRDAITHIKIVRCDG